MTSVDGHVAPREPERLLGDGPVPVTVVLPARLPDDDSIADVSLARWAHLVGSGRLHLILVTNGPSEPSAKLARRIGSLSSAGRLTHRHLGTRSGSKSDNLNAAKRIARTPVVAFFDIDAAPSLASVLEGARRVLSHKNGMHVVQGAKLIRRPTSEQQWCNLVVALLAWIEYRLAFILSSGLGRNLNRQTYFAGSNAYFDRESLAEYEFDGSAIAEDLDLSARLTKDDIQVDYCPELVSYESPPAGVVGYWRQHRRWAAGWFRTLRVHGPALLGDARFRGAWVVPLLWPVLVFGSLLVLLSVGVVLIGPVAGSISVAVLTVVSSAKLLRMADRLAVDIHGSDRSSGLFTLGCALLTPAMLVLVLASFVSIAGRTPRFEVTPKQLV